MTGTPNLAGVVGLGGTNTLDLSSVTTAQTIIGQLNGNVGPSIAPGANITNLIGTNSAGLDRFVGADQANVWNVTGANAGTYTSGAFPTVNFTSVEWIVGGASNDTVNMQTGGSLNGSVDGGVGSDTLSYAGRTTPVTLSIAPATATSVGSQWLGFETIVGGSSTNTLTASNVANTWTLTGPNTGTLNALTFQSFNSLIGGTSTDQFLLGNAGQVTSLSGGAGGTDTLSFATASSGVGITLTTLNSGSATRVGNFAGIDSLVGGTGSDTVTSAMMSTTFVVNAINTGTINSTAYFKDVENLVGGSGNDTITFTTTAAPALTSVNGGGGTDTMTGANSANLWTMTGAGSGTYNGTSFANLENLTGGYGVDTFNFTVGSISGNLNGNAGSDVLNVGGGFVNLATLKASGISGTFTSIESFTATNGTMTGANTTNLWRLTGLNTGTVNTSTSFSGFSTIIGGSAQDRLMFSTGGLSGYFDGGLGSDILDYSGVTTITRPYNPGSFMNNSVFDGLGGGNKTNILNFEQITGNT
jgi:hypothetical protein